MCYRRAHATIAVEFGQNGPNWSNLSHEATFNRDLSNSVGLKKMSLVRVICGYYRREYQIKGKILLSAGNFVDYSLLLEENTISMKRAVSIWSAAPAPTLMSIKTRTERRGYSYFHKTRTLPTSPVVTLFVAFATRLFPFYVNTFLFLRIQLKWIYRDVSSITRLPSRRTRFSRSDIVTLVLQTGVRKMADNKALQEPVLEHTLLLSMFHENTASFEVIDVISLQRKARATFERAERPSRLTRPFNCHFTFYTSLILSGVTNGCLFYVKGSLAFAVLPRTSMIHCGEKIREVRTISSATIRYLFRTANVATEVD